MSIQQNPVYILFHQWLASTVAPDANGDRKATVSQLWYAIRMLLVKSGTVTSLQQSPSATL